MEDYSIFACVDFWKDIKKLNIKSSFLECNISREEFKKLSTSEKIFAVPILRQISNAIKNKFRALNEIPNNNRNGQQPFLSSDWILWKMRWAVDNRGARYGLRIIYSVNGSHIVFSTIKHKKEIAKKETLFQQEAIERFKIFFACKDIE
ncbi:MAG: hypothetical protein KAV41_02385 [Candidatus Pacebacteria bacterium]|nr:hypothetical protein [Candidatus Paceibacterota bacterium]